MNRLKTATYISMAAIIFTACITGCGQRAGMQETITQDEAEEKVQEHINGVMSSLPEEAELETRQGMIFASCDDPTDGGPKDRVTVGERLWIRGIPTEENENNIDRIYDYWTNNGYQVLRDERPDKLSISVEDEEDFFRMSLQVSDQGSLSIGASSPCVWPEGTPKP